MKTKPLTSGSPRRLVRGFTLIEIAIVLVIIGLILGGILQGQQLITSARVRALADQMEDITVAWFAFQDRYRAFPGDFNNSTALIVGAGGTVPGGNGNGQVDAAENALVWQQLGVSGLLTGTYNGGSVGSNYNCPVSICPQNPFNRGILISFSDQSGRGVAANELWTGNQIPVAILAEMDRKVDDGAAKGGRLRAGVGAEGWSTEAAAACVNSDNNYNLATNSSDCAAVFRNF